MVKWPPILLVLCMMFSGCTLTVRNQSGQITTYRWPAPPASNQGITATTPRNFGDSNPGNSAYHGYNPQMQHQLVIPQAPIYYPPSTSEQQKDMPNSAYQTSESARSRDPLNGLMTTDQDKLDTALDSIIREYKRLYSDRAAQLIGFPNIPSTEKYATISRKELPVLTEPNITTDNLTILGLARSGEYFPVLDEVEMMATLGNPLSSRPSNAGKWCKVQIASGQSGWILAEPIGMGSWAFAQIVQRPQPVTRAAVATTADSGGSAIGVIIVLGLVLFLLIKLFSSNSSSVPSTSSGEGASSSNSNNNEERTSNAWFSDAFSGRTESKPKQGFFEKHGDYRDRVYLEGKERIIEDMTGTAPKQGMFESDDKYRSRIAHEANEAIIEKGTGSEPSQGFFEGDEKYRERVSHEANEEIISAATGSEPSQGFFESDDKYHDRVTHEANEHIIEEATGSAPSKGFFESDEAYNTRISQEAKDIKASDND